ncbi:MAG: heterocyst differentiation control protein [Cyanobacteria bacterium P01_E01_bin.6]
MEPRTTQIPTMEGVNLPGRLTQSAADSLLYNLAMVMMKQAGHRYGTFLDSASTAAKLTIYSTYLEKNKSFRKTGNFYHIESKRIKSIVQEIEDLLLNSDSLSILGSEEPSYLIDFPHLWFKTYPWKVGRSRIPLPNLTESERRAIEQKLPPSIPNARLIQETELDHLLRLLYEEATEKVAIARWHHFSEPLLNHLKCRLLEAQTIIRIDDPNLMQPLYVLTRMSYSPAGINEKLSNIIQDVARLFKLLLLWLDNRPNVLRAVETFQIKPGREQEAMAEIDTLLRNWADKYHYEGGTPMVLQAAAGPDNNPYFSKPRKTTSSSIS